MPETPETLDREQVMRGKAVVVVAAAVMQGFTAAAVFRGKTQATAVMAVEAHVRVGLLVEMVVLILTPAAR